MSYAQHQGEVDQHTRFWPADMAYWLTTGDLRVIWQRNPSGMMDYYVIFYSSHSEHCPRARVTTNVPFVFGVCTSPPSTPTIGSSERINHRRTCQFEATATIVWPCDSGRIGDRKHPLTRSLSLTLSVFRGYAHQCTCALTCYCACDSVCVCVCLVEPSFTVDLTQTSSKWAMWSSS